MTDKPKSTRIKISSPVGLAAYAWVNKPDAKFNPDAPDYKITLLIREGAEADAFEALIRKAGEDAAKKDGVKLKKGYNSPIKRQEDIDEDKRKPEFDGFVQFSFKSKQRPNQFDASLQPLPANIYPMSGDKVRVSALVSAYPAMGSGISAMLKGVQLLEKNHSINSGAGDFDVVEGGFVAASAPASSDNSAGADEDL